jgi:Methyltransferase domain
MVYDADYQNEQGHSPTFQRHLEDVAQLVQNHFHGRTLIEVGCGKGLFLEQLQALGFRVTGLDPTYEGTNPAVVREYFTAATGLRADGLVLRHVLEHVQDPVAFLARLRDANGGTGRIYIEVPCVDWIAEHRAWFDVFYEHVNYFGLEDFDRIFATVHESGRVFGGQYLYVVADLATVRAPTAPRRRFALPADFRASVDSAAAAIRGRRPGQRVAIWGGGSKGVIFALFMERAGASVDMLVDINPAKQGRHVAATGLYVHTQDEALDRLPAGSDVYVMNGNYLGEIEALTGGRFNYVTIDA